MLLAVSLVPGIPVRCLKIWAIYNQWTSFPALTFGFLGRGSAPLVDLSILCKELSDVSLESIWHSLPVIERLKDHSRHSNSMVRANMLSSGRI